MIHLLNNPTHLMLYHTSNQDFNTHFILEEVNPIRDIRITFDDFKAKGTKMSLQGLSLDIERKPVKTKVSGVKLHEVVVLNLDD